MKPSKTNLSSSESRWSSTRRRRRRKLSLLRGLLTGPQSMWSRLDGSSTM